MLKSLIKKQCLSLLISSSIFFMYISLGCAATYRFGYDVDHDKEYIVVPSGESTMSIFNFIDKEVNKVVTDDKTAITVSVKRGRQAFGDFDSWYFFGGYSESSSQRASSDVIGYTLKLKDFSDVSIIEACGGRTDSSHDANSNKLFIDNSKVNDVYGARTQYAGDVNGNEVQINNGSVIGNVHGGKTEEGDANDNAVTINNSTVVNNVYGGYSSEGVAQNNKIEISDSTANNVYGGISKKNNATANIVKIKNKNFKDIYGGFAGDIAIMSTIGIASDNEVFLDGVEVQNVYGGFGKTVSGNKVFIKNSTILNNLAGANNSAETASDTELTLLSADNSAKNVFNFDKINFGDADNKLSWTNENVFLTAEKFEGNNINLDVSNIEIPQDFSYENIGERMTLFKSVGDVSLPKFSVNDTEITAEGVGVLSGANSFVFENFKGLDIDLNCSPIQHIFLNDNAVFDELRGKVNKVTFGNVEWKENDESLIKEDKLDFQNADVDTKNINFTNVDSLNKDDSMILVENFGDTAGEIVGDTYKIKTTLEGKGKAKINGENLIFVIETAVKSPKTDEPKTDEPKTDEPKTDEPKTDEPKTDEPKTDEPKTDEPKTDEPKTDEPKTDEPKTDEPKTDEPKTDEPKTDEPKTDKPKTDKPKTDEPKTDEPKTDEPKTDEPKTDEPKTDEPKTDEPKTDKPKPDETPATPVLRAQEQTHNTVMGMEASVAMLTASNDFVQTAMEGISEGANVSADGVATYAGMGGGTSKTKTGSSVNANTWGAILAVGQERKLERGNFSYGLFLEHGNANYSLEPSNGMSGSSKYTGGGMFAKWTNTNNIYYEGSLRTGKVQDSASGILTDSIGNRYGYSVSSNYFGAHIGVGKIYKYQNDLELNVYGKFFYTRRGGISYEAGGLYNLDAVKSRVLKIGARYGKNKVGWNSYFGLAYAYEFDGVARGTADGYVIREASVKGGTLYGELGLRLIPSDTSKWKSNIVIKGHTGRSKGVSGHISIGYLF